MERRFLRLRSRRSHSADGPASDASLGRRDFLRTVAASAAALAAGSGAAAAALPSRVASRIDTVGLQLYTLRSLLAQDVEGTLAAVAGIGYREVEFAGLHGKTPTQMRAILDRVGLRAVSSHHSIADVRGDWTATLDSAQALGQGYVIVASIGAEDRASVTTLERVAADFNKAGEAAKSRGLQFGYHNHDFEFQPLEGRLPYQVLLERTDTALVAMEMDIFWMVNGGQDPLAYFAANPGRFPLVHAKDRSAAGAMVNVGAGVIDFRKILSQSGKAGIRHVLVEHDRPPLPIDDVRESYTFLKSVARG
jgi:sugar phosphate isomerase/epimerase